MRLVSSRVHLRVTVKARKLAKKVPNLIGDGVHNQPYGSGTVSMIIF